MKTLPLHKAALERPPRWHMGRWFEDQRKRKPPLNHHQRSQLASPIYEKPYSHEKLAYHLHSPYRNQELETPVQTKISTEVPYNPPNHSATMLSNDNNYYRALNESFSLLLKPQTENTNGTSPLNLASNPRLMSAIKSELEHAFRFGFHEISGARYAAFSVYKGRNANDESKDDKWHFISSSNTDPKIEDFNKLAYRRCAEDTASILAHLNSLDKLKYLFLYRAASLEAYAKGGDEPGIFPFFKLVPCKTCSKHLKKLLEDKGSLIIVTKSEQGKKLEASLKSNSSKAVNPKYLILENQKASDFSFTYSKENNKGDCFIEIASKNLPRLLLEKETGANVQSRNENPSTPRALISLGKYLNTEDPKARPPELSQFLNYVLGAAGSETSTSAL
ncbi:MAG: hypothetical protein ACKO3R_05975 [bacterium]